MILLRADSDAPVERLTSGGTFQGYAYIPPDGTAPPALPQTDVSDLPIPISKPVVRQGGNAQAGHPQVGNAPPKSVKPSVEPGDVAVAQAAGPSPTPLAQTPLPAGSMGPSANVGRQSIAVPNPGAVIHPAAMVPATIGAVQVAFFSSIHLAPADLVMPTVTAVASHSVAAVEVSAGIAYASDHAADALALLSAADGIAAAGPVAYNFVHFNPATLLNDAVAAFTRESASISLAPAAGHTTSRRAARAWAITAGVIGADLLLVAYARQRNRRPKVAAGITAGRTDDGPIGPGRAGRLR